MEILNRVIEWVKILKITNIYLGFSNIIYESLIINIGFVCYKCKVVIMFTWDIPTFYCLDLGGIMFSHFNQSLPTPRTHVDYGWISPKRKICKEDSSMWEYSQHNGWTIWVELCSPSSTLSTFNRYQLHVHKPIMAESAKKNNL